MNVKISLNHISWLVIVVVAFASCKTTRIYKQPDNMADTKLYRDTVHADTTNIANIPWKQMFSDTCLQSIILEGIENNLDLKIAQARIKKAYANFYQSKLASIPTLGLSANGTVQQLSAAQGGAFIPSQSYQVSLVSGWEADIWGKLSSTKRANLALLMQSDAFKRSVQTQLVSDIATNYFSLLAFDAQLKITERALAYRTEDVVTIKVLKESDVVTGAAVVQSEANRYAAEVTIPDLKQDIRETENRISILIGRSPDSIARNTLSTQGIDIDLKTGIPAQLLSNRPDVQAAEYQVRYNFELINVAKAYFYPTITITAQGGLSNGNIFQFLNASSLFGNVVAGLAQPIFNQGINKQRLTVAEANQEEALAAFKQSLLSAGEEVSNAMYNYQAGVEKELLRKQQIDYLVKAVDFTKELLKYSSSTSYLDVLTSEQSLLSAQLSGINDKLQQMQAIISLYRSLGGGWR